MWSGKCLQLLCIVPFGIFCMSASRMRFVIIITVVCILVGMMVCTNADSVSSVNCVHSDFLC